MNFALHCAVSILVACGIASAQTAGTGALTITTIDPSGAVIVGANITLTNGAAVTRKQTTGADGSYTFGLLPPGTYHVALRRDIRSLEPGCGQVASPGTWKQLPAGAAIWAR
ncbi:MAG TPA: carboxypeptidase-like regulatory domain-containing protein [Bryobacteraceae bacterium]